MDVLPVRPVETFAESNRTRGGRKNRQALSNLREAIHSPVYQVKQWQTATVSTGAHKQKDGSMTDKLDQQVKSWATPDASDRRSDNCRQVGLSNQTQGKLNPRWVETLMGLPVGWTMPSCVSAVTIERMSFDSSETVLSQQQPTGHL
jgi:predicted transcriptional regulator